MTRIAVADDHRLVRAGIRRLLDEQPDLHVTREAGSTRELREAIGRGGFDVLILDVTMHGERTLEDLRELNRSADDIRVLVLSMCSESDCGPPFINAGADGYLSKDADPEEVVAAVRRIAGGGRYASPALARLLMWQGRTGSPPAEVLSQRETEIVRAIAAGERLRDIAGRLNLNDRTVSTYRSRILRKLGLRTNADIARIVHESRLV
ncbi:MAG: response regulator [Spirochaetota bacterium]